MCLLFLVIPVFFLYGEYDYSMTSFFLFLGEGDIIKLSFKL